MEIQLPEIIFIDTSSLRRLAGGFENVDLIELRELSTILKIDIVLPEVVVMEWERYKRDELDKHIAQIRSSSGFLHNLFGESFLLTIPEDAANKMVRKVYDDLLKTGFKIAATPQIGIGNLVKMAVDKVPPFEEKGEKGFRDSVILETMSSEMTTRGISTVAFITADLIFNANEIKDKFKALGFRILIYPDIQSLHKFLLSEMIRLGKYSDQRANDVILQSLNANFSQVSDYLLKNAEVSEMLLTGFGDKKDFYGTIRKILSVRPVKVTKVSSGGVFVKQVIENGRKNITFSTEVEFTVLASMMGLYNLYSSRKFLLGDPQSFENMKYSEPQLTEKKLCREINVEASVGDLKEGALDIKFVRVLSF